MTADKFIERCKTELGYTNENFEDDCYHPVDNTCDGRCQGCSSCILVREFHTGKKEPPAWKCRDIIFKSRKEHYELKQEMEEFKKTPQYQEFVKEVESTFVKEVKLTISKLTHK